MSRFLDKIKNILEILFGKKTKMLPSDNTKTNYDINNKTTFRNEQKSKANIGVKNTYLEKALSQYFEEYLRQLNEAKKTNEMPNSYRALTSINATKGHSELNIEDEINLLKQIESSNEYNIELQEVEDINECCFYHVQKRGYKPPNEESIIRIYLNCKDENVAELTSSLLNNSENPNFYLKFASTESMQRRARSEKIVIYTDDKHLQQDLESIEQLKKDKPNLFKGSENTNPFMQQVEDTYSVVRQTNNGEYINLKGEKKIISNSNNTYIAQILQDSYTETVQDIAKKDPNISFLLDSKNDNNYYLYMRNYRYINAHHHSDLINLMESKMKILAANNNIEIKGISSNIKEGEKEQKENSL